MFIIRTMKVSAKRRFADPATSIDIGQRRKTQARSEEKEYIDSSSQRRRLRVVVYKYFACLMTHHSVATEAHKNSASGYGLVSLYLESRNSRDAVPTDSYSANGQHQELRV